LTIAVVKRSVFLDALIREPLQFFKDHPFFTRCTKQDVEKIALLTQVKLSNHGDLITEAGKLVDHVIFIKQGQLKVRLPVPIDTAHRGEGPRPGTGSS